VSSLIKGKPPIEAYEDAVEKALKYYSNKNEVKHELVHFDKILSNKIAHLQEEQVASDGYVDHTLEASLWCRINTESYQEAVLKAVNLGYDTDTTGIVTGGLAGIYYGFDAIPKEWIDTIIRKEEISNLFEGFCKNISYKTTNKN
ncbi:MAG: ADP-ribosylglycohydrolase family protein, partial [Syntrophorhabdaceae bacterium]|nr:ADP-ribosylglycohydrolase family protein [Syntrophorhabdaceae bacterium]